MHRGRSLLALITILSGVVAPKPTDVFELELDEAWTALDPTAILEQGPIDPFDPLSVEYPEPRLAELDPLPVWASWYSVPRVYAVTEGVPLLDMKGAPLGPMLQARDFCRAAIEGTVQVVRRRGGRRLYAFAGLGEEHQTDCSTLYKSQPAAGRARFRRVRRASTMVGHHTTVVPYRTLAVDPSFIPLGSVVYIPAARGTVVALEDGTSRLHDGYFYALDTGGGIEGNHIDVFLGIAAQNPFIFVKTDPKETVEAYVVSEPELEDAFAFAHGTFSLRAGE